jgi:hypothetical protein
MAFDWEHVEAIRAEQDSARNRRDLNTLPTNEVSNEIYNSPSGREAKISGLDHWEQMIYKVRTQLIDYIIEHGLVQGFEYDGINEPIKNGKIVLTAEMLQRVTDRFGYFKEKETLEFIEKYLPEHYYVSDADYVHTDNNYTDEEKAKLEGIEDGAEVNKVISILFNGVETIDPATRVATITITPADIKAWYEQNPDTNVFSDADKEKLDGIEANAQVNKVEDVTVDGVTVLDSEDKTAKITKKLVKASYESNPDTNAFTDAEKTKLEGIEDGAQVNDVIDVTLDGKSVVDRNKIAVLTAAAIKTSYESNANTNAFTDADKELVEKTVPTLVEESHDHEKRIGALELSQHVQDDEISKLKEKDIALENEITETKNSISELGDEVNSVAGRVTNLEASQKVQDGDIAQLKEDIKNAGKVDDVKVGGTSVVKNKVAEIPAISNIVVNCLALSENTPVPEDTGTVSANVLYELQIWLDRTKLPKASDFISVGTEIIGKDGSDPKLYAEMEIRDLIVATGRIQSETYIAGFKITFRFSAKDGQVPPNDVNALTPDNFSVNITTKDTEVLLDLDHTRIVAHPQ